MSNKPARPIPPDDPRFQGINPGRTYPLAVAKRLLGIQDAAYRTLCRKGGLKPLSACGKKFVSGQALLDAIARVDAASQEGQR